MNKATYVPLVDIDVDQVVQEMLNEGRIELDPLKSYYSELDIFGNEVKTAMGRGKTRGLANHALPTLMEMATKAIMCRTAGSSRTGLCLPLPTW